MEFRLRRTVERKRFPQSIESVDIVHDCSRLRTRLELLQIHIESARPDCDRRIYRATAQSTTTNMRILVSKPDLVTFRVAPPKFIKIRSTGRSLGIAG